MKESNQFNDRDDKLIRYLIRKNEWAPFRHSFMTFEVKAPLMVARQWWKYIKGSDHTMEAWSEASRRYITMEPEFYLPSPEKWRSAPDNKKQGSGEPIDINIGKGLTLSLDDYIAEGLKLYNYALEQGVAPEQARLLLPAYGMYTVWRWTGSINSICHFLAERLASGAQDEITQYAKVTSFFVDKYFPATMKHFKAISEE